MNATNRYLDAVRDRHGLPSDRQLGKHLGIPPNRISNYRNDESTQLTEQHALAVAESLGVPFAQVMAEVRAERTKHPTVRAAWLDLVRRLGGPGAAAALVLTLLGGLFPQPASAATGYTLCALGGRRRRGSAPSLAAGLLVAFGLDPDNNNNTPGA